MSKEDLDLDKKMYEEKMKKFDEGLIKLQEEHGIKLQAVLIANPSGLVEPKILKTEWEDES